MTPSGETRSTSEIDCYYICCSNIRFQSIKTNPMDFRLLPKADLHNHLLLGGRLAAMERFSGRTIQPFKSSGKGIADINRWIREEYAPLMRNQGAFEASVEAAFIQAKEDGVTILEASIDAGFGARFGILPANVIGTIRTVHKKTAPELDFRPCLGLVRNLPAKKLMELAEPWFASGYFYSIDLYDDELSQPVENFREIYRVARKQGLICKAHAGEFGPAEDVRKAVETLELDGIQHGIAAATSPEVMRWLAGHHIPLHVSPASNIALGLVESYKTHPIRILFDHGVRVTINTDDVMLFSQSLSEEYRNLYAAGLFSAEELEEIRKFSLISP
jgi:adenosine deaminase